MVADEIPAVPPLDEKENAPNTPKTPSRVKRGTHTIPEPFNLTTTSKKRSKTQTGSHPDSDADLLGINIIAWLSIPKP